MKRSTLAIAVFVCVSACGGSSVQTPKAAPSKTPPTTLSPADKLAAIEKVRLQTVGAGIAETRKVVADITLCQEPKAVAGAWGKLKVATKDDPGWPDAQKLAAKLEACRKKIERDTNTGMLRLRIQQREELARKGERSMLDQGLEMNFKAWGKNKKWLTVEWILMSKVAVHKITNGRSHEAGGFLSNMEKAGFEAVSFTDGHDFSDVFGLSPEDETQIGVGYLKGAGLPTPLVLK